MTAVKEDFTLTAGDDEDIQIHVFNKYGVPINLKDYTVEWTFNGVTKKTPNDVVVLDHIATVKIKGSDTVNLLGDYPHSCKVVTSVGKKNTVCKGTVKVEK